HHPCAGTDAAAPPEPPCGVMDLLTKALSVISVQNGCSHPRPAYVVSIQILLLACGVRRAACGGSAAHAAVLDHDAAVLHVLQPGLLGNAARLGRADARLQPERLRALVNGLARDVGA